MFGLREGRNTGRAGGVQVLEMLGVPKVVLEVEGKDEAAVGETEFCGDGPAQVSCVDSTLPDAPKMVALIPE